MARREHHVVPHPNEGWDVKRDGSDTVIFHAKTKQVAVKQGRILSRLEGTEFIIHGKDGRIQSSDSHGNDLYPPRG
jgi:hypothetical protein